MALNKLKLKNDLLNVFDVNKLTPSNIQDASERITNSVTSYLKDVTLSQHLVGIGPSGNDPSFFPGILFKPTVPATANSSILQQAIVNNLKINFQSNLNDWSLTNAAFLTYLGLSFLTFKTKDGYIASGIITPGVINLNTVFNSNDKSSEKLSADLADHIHNFFSKSNFAGSYLKGAFAGQIASNLI